MAYGERLRELRAERRLSLRQVEARGGPNKDTMSLIERGVHKPHAPTLGRIAQALDMSVAELRAELEAAEGPLATAPPSQGKLFNNGVLVEERRSSVFVAAIADAAEKWLAAASDPNVDPRKVFGVATAALGLAQALGDRLRSGVQGGTLSPEERQEIFQTLTRLVEVAERYVDRVENEKTRSQLKEQISELQAIA